MTKHKASNFETSFSQKLNCYQPVYLPAKVSHPFQGWGQNVFITCYKNIQGWLNCSTLKMLSSTTNPNKNNIAALRKQVGV